MKNTSKILLPVFTVLLFSGCSLAEITEIPERKSPESTPSATSAPVETLPTAEPLTTPPPVPTATPTTSGVQTVNGSTFEQVDEYLQRVTELQQELEQKIQNTRPTSTPESDEVSFSSWFSIPAFASDIEGIVIEENTTTATDETNTTGDDEPATIDEITFESIEEESSVSEILNEIEINIALATESLEGATDPQEIAVLLLDIQTLHDDTILFLDTLETSEYTDEITTVQTSLEELGDTIAIATQEVEQSLENGEETIVFDIETTIDVLPTGENGEYPIDFNRALVQEKKKERAEKRLERLQEKLIHNGVDPEKVEEILLKANTALQNAANNPDEMRNAIQELGAIHILQKQNITPEQWEQKKSEWKQLHAEHKKERRAERKNIHEQVKSGDITKNEAQEMFKNIRQENAQKRTEKIAERIAEKNPAAAERFTQRRNAAVEKREEQAETRQQKREQVQERQEQRRENAAERIPENNHHDEHHHEHIHTPPVLERGSAETIPVPEKVREKRQEARQEKREAQREGRNIPPPKPAQPAE